MSSTAEASPPLQGHSFAVLPMPIVVYFGETSSMCDNACEDMMTPEQLLAYERVAIDHHLRTDEPLIFEWHPGTTHPDDEAGWWDAFTGLISFSVELEPAPLLQRAATLMPAYGVGSNVRQHCRSCR